MKKIHLNSVLYYLLTTFFISGEIKIDKHHIFDCQDQSARLELIRKPLFFLRKVDYARNL